MRFSLRPAGEKVAWAQPMTDEGDHGDAPVIDGPLRSNVGASVVARADAEVGPYKSHRKSV